MKIPISLVTLFVKKLLECPDAKQMVAYLEQDLRIKATRLRKRDNDFRLNIGKPNYAERKFVKCCEKAGEPFPIQKIQIKWFRK